MKDLEGNAANFGANAWLVDDMYEQYRQDPQSVSESWRDFFQDYRPGGANLARPSSPELRAPDGDRDARFDAAGVSAGPGPATPSGPARPAAASAGAATVAAQPDRTGVAPRERPALEGSGGLGLAAGSVPAAVTPAQTAPPAPTVAATPASAAERGAEKATPLRGAAGRIVANMTASLDVPTATSFRVVPARLLEVNRRILNNQLSRTGSAGKVSFTHLIGYAVVEALQAIPVMNSTFVAADSDDPKAVPAVVRHEHIGLGIAVDNERPDGSRTLLVPVIKDAGALDFRGFWSAYEDLIRKVRTNKIGADDLAGATVTLTNPGTHRHGAVGSPADARTRRHHRRRRHRLPRRVAGGRPEGAGRAGCLQGGNRYLDLRPPDHPGRRVRTVPPARPPAADRGGRPSTSGCSRPWACPTSRYASTGTSTTSPAAPPSTPRSRSRWTTSSTCTGSGAT